MSKSNWRRGWIAAGLVVLIVLAAYIGGGSVRQRSIISADHRYRGDFFTATRWQWSTHVLQMEEPGTAIVVRLADGHASGRSPVVELNDSPVFWLPESALIGTQAKYVFVTDQWERSSQ